MTPSELRRAVAASTFADPTRPVPRVRRKRSLLDPLEAAISEKDWQEVVVSYALLNKWLVYHTHDSRRSEAGFPDLVMVRGGRCVVAELKREGKAPTQAQREWLEALGKVPGVQLGTIERCIRLWSNPGEVVLSPFAGIGSEIYSAVKLGRKGLGIELKRRYWQTAIANVRCAEAVVEMGDLFSQAGIAVAGAAG